MSSDFYFRKWKKILAVLEELVHLDLDYQTSKIHDKKRCEASLRLSSVLGQYLTVYNEVVECLRENLQVQKVRHIEGTEKAIVSRILELKHELSKLDGSEHLFLSNGLIYHRLTTHDAEVTQIPSRAERPPHILYMIKEIVERTNERKKYIEEQKLLEKGLEEEHVVNWWDQESNAISEEESSIEERKGEITEEQMKINMNIEMIQAHEKTRQVTARQTQYHNKRQRWEKELLGTAAPKASHEILERSAAIIQKVCRVYFECKRKKYLECKRDELLGLRQCVKPMDAQEKHQHKVDKTNLKINFEDEWRADFEILKGRYLERKGDEIIESYRDHIRDWFYDWFEEIKFFHDIPNEKAGGSKLILKEELPAPQDWLEEYKAYITEKKSIKKKTALQLKYEKLEAKKQEAMDKKRELQKKKFQKDLKRKLLKNPTLHPGFIYPESKKIEKILQVIEEYHTDWDEFDETDALDVKKQHCKIVDKNNAIMAVKMEVIPQVDEDMRLELKKLKVALKKDYETNEEDMPEPMKKRRKREKKKHIVKITMSENFAEKMEELVFRGFIKEYPRTKLEDFVGDPNFVGDDIRCNYESALQLHGEIRSIWWEKCRELVHGCRRILLVGPKGGGKTLLIHALASLNDAILFELDPSAFDSELVSDAYLQQIVQYVVTCARAAQPAVIHIKHVHRFYYKKVPPEEAKINMQLFKRHFTKKLFKKIHKTDNVTVIGSCVDPWLAKSKRMLKHFPNVVLLPNTTYSTVVQILNEWVLSNHVLPAELNVSSLAQVLQGYSFGFLKQFLEGFLSAERIARIAAHGLSPTEVLESILEYDEDKIDYSRYLKWYSDYTQWGKREKTHLQEQREFQQALEKWTRKMEMEKKKSTDAHRP